MPELKNQRHEIFAGWVAKGTPAYIAYGKAGYKTEGMPNEHMQSHASRLMRNDKIVTRIKELQSKAANAVVFEITDVLKGLIRGATFDIRKLYDENGQLKKVCDLDDETARVVIGVDEDEIYDPEAGTVVGTTKKVKLERREKYWEMLGRHFKMFTDVIKHEGLDNLAAELNAARERE